MGRDKRQPDRNYVLWLAGGVVVAIIGASLFQPKNAEKPVGKASVQQSALLEHRASQADQKEDVLPSQVRLRYDYYGYDMVKAISVDIGEAVRTDWQKYAPVFATIYGSGQETLFPVEKGNSFRYEISPFHPAGKEFIVYGKNKETGQIHFLHRKLLNDLLPETRRK